MNSCEQLSRKRNSSQDAINYSGKPKEYERTGDGIGKSSSTEGIRSSALAQFNVFLRTKHIDSYQELREDQFNLVLMQELGTFFSFDAIGEDGCPLSLGTAWTYFGSIKNYIKDHKFKKLFLWGDQSWYTKIRNGIEGNISRYFSLSALNSFFEYW